VILKRLQDWLTNNVLERALSTHQSLKRGFRALFVAQELNIENMKIHSIFAREQRNKP